MNINRSMVVGSGRRTGNLKDDTGLREEGVQRFPHTVSDRDARVCYSVGHDV